MPGGPRNSNLHRNARYANLISSEQVLAKVNQLAVSNEIALNKIVSLVKKMRETSEINLFNSNESTANSISAALKNLTLQNNQNIENIKSALRGNVQNLNLVPLKQKIKKTIREGAKSKKINNFLDFIKDKLGLELTDDKKIKLITLLKTPISNNTLLPSKNTYLQFKCDQHNRNSILPSEYPYLKDILKQI